MHCALLHKALLTFANENDMKSSHRFALSLIVSALGFAASPLAPLSMSAAQAQAAAGDTVRPEIGKLSKPLQDAIAAKQFPEATAILAQIDAMTGKSAYETYYADTARATIAQGTGDKAGTVAAYRKLVDSGRLGPAVQVKTIQQLGARYYELQDYPQAIVWLSRFLKEAGDDRDMRLLLAQSHYLSNDFPNTIKETRALVKADEAAGVKPPEATLQLLVSAATNAKDSAATSEALEKYVLYYPKKEYWNELINRVTARPGHSQRLLLDVYRLKFATGTMNSANDYMVMTQLLLQAGFPGEAKKVADQGYASAVMGGGSASDIRVQQELRDKVNKDAAADLKNLAAGEADANKPGKDGSGLSNLGFALVQAGQFDKGLALMERGAARGLGVRAEEGKLHYGIAQMLAGRRDDALKTFASVGGSDGAADLARYWALHLQSTKA